jgi:alcohol dehydrogenase class IV
MPVRCAALCDAAARPCRARVAAAVAPFEFQTATRTVFGRDALERVPALVRELATLEGVDVEKHPVFIVAGASTRFSTRLETLLRDGGVGGATRTFHCPRGEPTVASALAAPAAAVEGECGVVIAIGGGTPVDTAKCVAAMMTNRRPGETPDVYEHLEVVGRGRPLTKRTAPFIAIPTTAGPGAEVAKNAVLEAGDRKVSMRHPFMLPSVAVIDPMLTLSLPRDVTVDTGLDALTQCIEPYVCCVPNPMIDAISMAGVVAGAGALRRAVDDGADVDAREQMCLCSYYGGLSLANAKLGAVHGFSGTLGGLLHAPHGAICAALLPHSWTINVAALEGRVAAEDPALAARALERYAQVARAITGNADATVQDGIAWIVDLCEYCGVPGLGSLGLKESDFASVVEKSKQSSSMKGNCVALNDAELTAMLKLAM